MRIIGGAWRGRRLASLGKGDAAAHLRPTSDRVRESLFNLLAHGLEDPVTDALVLDLFAGTGALGLEALSRGAASASFVENGRKSLSLLKSNIDTLDASSATILARDARRLGPGTPHDLIFLDPPYGKDLGRIALEHAAAQGWLARGAVVIWEDNRTHAAPPGFVHHQTRSFGASEMTILTFTGD